MSVLRFLCLAYKLLAIIPLILHGSIFYYSKNNFLSLKLAQKEEERAADEWERKMAFVLISHDFGLLFEPLAKGLKSKFAALFSACFVSATWLSHMLRSLPDTGILETARVCLLDHFLSIFTTTTDVEEKTLGLLAINSFVHEPGR